MALLVLHPNIANRDCDHCHQFVYNEEKGGILETYGGQPVPRPKVAPPPCRLKGKGCPKGAPESSRALSVKNEMAYRHYLECKAVGSFPDDPIVKRNAGIIYETERTAREQKFFRNLSVIVGGIG